MVPTAGEGLTPKASGQARDTPVGSGGPPALQSPSCFEPNSGKQAWARMSGFPASERHFHLQLLRPLSAAALTRTQS